MPLLSSVLWMLGHCLLAIGINTLGIWLGVINYGEFFSLYFFIFAGKLYDAQMKFTKAYKEDPELVEKILRHQLLNGRD